MDASDVLPAIKGVTPRVRLGYVELLQEQVTRKQDRPGEKSRAEEERDEPPPPGQNPFSTPHCVPAGLAVSHLGGRAPSPEQVLSLRRILFGNTQHTFSYGWKKASFKFREPFSEAAYALEAERGGAGAVQMAVQAHILTHLLFSRDGSMLSMAKVGEKEQSRALGVAITHMLWRCGEEQSATVCLASSQRPLVPPLEFKPDGLTETVQLFTFQKKEDVRAFVTEHVQCFTDEGSHGVILFLYSLVFSRGTDRIRADFDFTVSQLLQLSFGNFICRQALLNLLLTGRATPHVFNGSRVDEDSRPQHGVRSRSHVGFLLWSRELAKRAALPQVGSMLKTPRLPVWLCSINGSFSVLFSSARSLLSDWKMEHLFQLHYYNGQSGTAVLDIDTHSHHWEAGHGEGAEDPEKRFPSLEMTIRTKWAGAVINWNGAGPFF